jgi:hypothetical protein
MNSGEERRGDILDILMATLKKRKEGGGGERRSNKKWEMCEVSACNVWSWVMHLAWIVRAYVVRAARKPSRLMHGTEDTRVIRYYYSVISLLSFPSPFYVYVYFF